MKKRHSEEQIIRILREAETNQIPIREVCRQHNITEQTLYRWRNKYGGMDVTEAQEAKQLRDENTRLRKLVADLSLDKEALQSVIRKNGWSS